ncbi:MAG: DUF3604 domain-containing protein [Clostridia bacterium]|nr:DUF3604 domain-containing protein [Clostridia bacterium]
MKKQFISSTGRRIAPKDLIANALAEEGVALANGVRSVNEISGYQYKGSEISSFMEVWAAYAITMSATDYMTWTTDAFNQDAPNGVVFINEFAMGNGDAFPQPNGQFDLYVGQEKLLSFNMKKHDHLFEENGVRMFLQAKKRRFTSDGDCFTMDEFVRDECAYVEGVMYLYLSREALEQIPRAMFGAGDSIQFTLKSYNVDMVSKRWFRLGYSPMLMLMTNVYDGINTVLHGLTQRAIGGKNVYFGDIHIHSWDTTYFKETGCGRKSVLENLDYARNVAGCDFAAITDHDWQMNAEDWVKLRQETESRNDEGKFVTLHAFEWTSTHYGHRNIYFRGNPDVPVGQTAFDFRRVRVPIKYGGPTIPEEDPTPAELWAWLDENNYEAISIPHHPNAYQFPMDFHYFFSEKYDRAVEIYSGWGSMMDASHPINTNAERIPELGIQHYNNSGLHFAFIASSDSHDGNGGDSNVTLYKKQFSHYPGSGRVAVPADKLTRENIWQGIHSRHCYAVTGEPILLTFCAGEASMGDVITNFQGTLTFTFEVEGTYDLKHVTIYKNGIPLKRYTDLNGSCLKGSATDDHPECGAWYWMEVEQKDAEMAWSSPIWYEPEA